MAAWTSRPPPICMLSSVSLSRMQCQQLNNRAHVIPTRKMQKNGYQIVAYMENSGNPITRVLSSLPIVGLLMRIASDEGGIGGDRVDYLEFCTRVQRRCPPSASYAFTRFADRHGKVAKPQYVILWCWAAAVGAGLLKSEDINYAALRLRVSYDIQYEVDTFLALMDEAQEKRKKSKSPVPEVPMITRINKAADGICSCCIGKKTIDSEDAEMITTILSAVFPGVPQQEIESVVSLRLPKSIPSSETDELLQI